MSRSLLLPLGLLLAAPASAADLDLTIISDGIGPVSLTLKDVKPGPLPSADVPGPDGRSVRIDLVLSDSMIESDPSFDLKMHITRRTPEGRRKVHEEVSDPTVCFRPNQDAEVSIGGRRPVPGTDPIEWEPVNFFQVKARIRTDAATP